MSSIQINTEVNGYKVEKELANTFMSIVYKGVEVPNNNEVVAIKVLINDNDSFRKSQLIQEGEILKELCQGTSPHQHIVKYKDHGSYNNVSPYLIMEFVSERSLRTFMNERNQRPPLNPNNVVKYMQQAVDALQHLHDKNIIHSDIRPEHLLLKNNDTEIVLCDFGHAVRLPLGAMNIAVQPLDAQRTPNYMAPEQIGQKGYHCYASDQYALALVISELLCGGLPQPHPSTPQDWAAGPFALLNPKIVDVLTKALSFDPNVRFSTVSTFVKALAHEVNQISSTGQIVITNPSSSSPQPQPLSSIAQTPPPNQSIAYKAKAITRRGLFAFAAMDVITLVTLVASWTELRPKITQLLSPSPSLSPSPNPSPNQFGNIYNIYLGHQKNINGVAWSPDKKQIASGSFDKTIQVWNVSDTQHPLILKGHTEPVNDVLWFPNSDYYVASCSGLRYGKDCTVRIWDLSNGRNVIIGEHTDLINAISCSPDGTMIASACFDSTVAIWSTTSVNQNKPLFVYSKHKSSVFDVAWATNGKPLLASCSTHPENQVHVWNANTGKDEATFIGHTDDILSVAWKPGEDIIASSSKDGTVQIWSYKDKKPIYKSPIPFPAPIRRVKWSSNGKYLAAGTRFLGAVYVWETITGRFISTSPYDERKHDIADVTVNALAWSSDGKKIATGGTDNLVQVWWTGLSDVDSNQHP